MDETNGLCQGCFRTIDEIIRWIDMSDEEKKEVIDELKKREKEINKNE